MDGLTLDKGRGLAGRAWVVAVLTLALAVVALGSLAQAAGIVEQVRRPDGKTLMITGRNQLQAEAIQAYYHLMIVYTPDFGQPVTVLGGPTTVVAVSGGVVSAIKTDVPPGQVPLAIPANGYLIVGIGKGWEFLKALKVGDKVEIIEKEAVTPDPLPTTVVAETGEVIPITNWNTGRGPNELIVYTPDWGNCTYTNIWGAEALVQNGEVVYVRQIKENPPLDIPEGAIVISGHDQAGFWIIANLIPGSKVSLE